MTISYDLAVSHIDPLRRFSREVASIFDNRRRFRPHAPSSGLVVEVGGGHSPYPRADLVIEKYVADDFERADKMSFTRPLVVGDGQRIPLSDDCAAYAIASHVLEHATDPTVFASELSRIARAGYIEVPSRESELTYGWPFHPWLIDLDGDTLVFEPRQASVAPLGQMHHTLFRDSILQQLSFASHRQTWHHAVEWVDTLNVRVLDSSTAPSSASFELDATIRALESATTTPLPTEVVRILTCPSCRAWVQSIDSARLKCTSCESLYPIVNQVPILIEGVTI